MLNYFSINDKKISNLFSRQKKSAKNTSLWCQKHELVVPKTRAVVPKTRAVVPKTRAMVPKTRAWCQKHELGAKNTSFVPKTRALCVTNTYP
jgi:hypothetical protein